MVYVKLSSPKISSVAQLGLVVWSCWAEDLLCPWDWRVIYVHVVDVRSIWKTPARLFDLEIEYTVGWTLSILSQSNNWRVPLSIRFCVASDEQVSAFDAVVLVEECARNSQHARLLVGPVHCQVGNVYSDDKAFVRIHLLQCHVNFIGADVS